MKALIIVDVQYDFCPGGALPVREGDQVVPVINKVRDLFDAVVFTQDWHPKNHSSFASTNNRKVGEVIDIKGIMQVMWPDHCIQGTKGARLHGGLIVREDDFIVQKGTDPEVDSYSAFFDNQRIHKTTLDDYLKEKGIKDLYVTGLATDYCVKFTVLDALDLGYHVTVASDGVRGVNLNPMDADKALEEMKCRGAHVLTSHTLMERLAPR